jgi:hypothetical protein
MGSTSSSWVDALTEAEFESRSRFCCRDGLTERIQAKGCGNTGERYRRRSIRDSPGVGDVRFLLPAEEWDFTDQCETCWRFVAVPTALSIDRSIEKLCLSRKYLGTLQFGRGRTLSILPGLQSCKQDRDFDVLQVYFTSKPTTTCHPSKPLFSFPASFSFLASLTHAGQSCIATPMSLLVVTS